MDIIDIYLEKYRLIPHENQLDEIRYILSEETDKEKKEQGQGNTELIKLCCIQLFSKKNYEDIFLIWKAKTASFDAENVVDIQMLCANGLLETKKYLQESKNELATHILHVIVESENLGYFSKFSFEKEMANYEYYYSDEEE